MAVILTHAAFITLTLLCDKERSSTKEERSSNLPMKKMKKSISCPELTVYGNSVWDHGMFVITYHSKFHQSNNVLIFVKPLI